MLTPYVGFITTDGGMLILYVEAEDFDDAEEQFERYVAADHDLNHGCVMWVEAWNQNLEDDFKYILTSCTSKHLTLEDY